MSKVSSSSSWNSKLLTQSNFPDFFNINENRLKENFLSKTFILIKIRFLGIFVLFNFVDKIFFSGKPSSFLGNLTIKKWGGNLKIIEGFYWTWLNEGGINRFQQKLMQNWVFEVLIYVIFAWPLREPNFLLTISSNNRFCLRINFSQTSISNFSKKLRNSIQSKISTSFPFQKTSHSIMTRRIENEKNI